MDPITEGQHPIAETERSNEFSVYLGKVEEVRPYVRHQEMDVTGGLHNWDCGGDHVDLYLGGEGARGEVIVSRANGEGLTLGLEQTQISPSERPLLVIRASGTEEKPLLLKILGKEVSVTYLSLSQFQSGATNLLYEKPTGERTMLTANDSNRTALGQARNIVQDGKNLGLEGPQVNFSFTADFKPFA
ncbi:hypothetical protein M1349_03705 [Patescibacteria group bacterium]|nr:hypothetical protein [Patescibacteria group bacterium]